MAAEDAAAKELLAAEKLAATKLYEEERAKRIKRGLQLIREKKEKDKQAMRENEEEKQQEVLERAEGKIPNTETVEYESDKIFKKLEEASSKIQKLYELESKARIELGRKKNEIQEVREKLSNVNSELKNIKKGDETYGKLSNKKEGYNQKIATLGGELKKLEENYKNISNDVMKAEEKTKALKKELRQVHLEEIRAVSNPKPKPTMMDSIKKKMGFK